MSIKQSIILFISAILLGFLLILPFNFTCKAMNWCDPVILSYYLPQMQGKEKFEIFFEAKDKSKQVNMESQRRSVVIKTGQNIKISYKIMNPSDEEAKLSPRLYVQPKEAAKYLKFYECLCFKEHKIGARKIKNLNVRFKLNREIENDKFFKNRRIITIGYEIQ